MTDTNEEKKPPARIIQPHPELESKQPLPITTDVDMLWGAVMERGKLTEAEYEENVGKFEHTEDPARFLRHKRLFLGRLLMKGLHGTGKEQEQWEETWKDLLQAWFTPLMRVAVYEPDPSFNRWFLEPALRACGYRRVWEALLEYLERGTNLERAGVERALYWAWGLSAREDQKNFQKISDELADLAKRAHLLLLKTVVECEDLNLQRSLFSMLSMLKPSSYPPEWQPLLAEAMHLARTHPDDYVRRCMKVLLGGSGLSSEKDAPLEETSQE